MNVSSLHFAYVVKLLIGFIIGVYYMYRKVRTSSMNSMVNYYKMNIPLYPETSSRNRILRALTSLSPVPLMSLPGHEPLSCLKINAIFTF